MTLHQAQEVDCPELYALLKSEHPPTILDILPPEYYEKIRIPSALNACAFNADFIDLVQEISADQNDLIVVYGVGEDSLDWRVAVDKLHHAGYSNVSVLKAGIEGWVEAGYSVDGTEKKIQEDDRVFSIQGERRWKIDSEQSVLEWQGRKSTGHHHGTIKVSGHIFEENGELRGTIFADMKTIQDVDLEGDPLKPVLEHHLNSEDFFFTKLFPTAKFEITKTELNEVQSITYPQILATGTLTVRGVSHTIEVPLVITDLDETTISIETHFDIDRTKWGIIYGSSRFFRHLSYHKVFDIFSAQCLLYGELSPPNQ